MTVLRNPAIRAIALSVVCFSVLGLDARGALAKEPTVTSSKAVSYYRDVWPIFRDRCQGCHQPAKAGGKLVLTSLERLLEGGRSDDPIIVAGKPDESLLVAEITREGDDAPSMPKDGEALSKAQVALIRQWILEGARDDTPASAKLVVDADHPPVYEHMPLVTTLDYSPDGALLAVAGYHEVLLHKSDGSQLVARLIGLAERIQSLKFSPDGKSLAVVGGNPAQLGEVQVWDVARRRLRISVPVTYDTLYGVSWSPDSKLVGFGGADNSVRVVEAASGKQVLFQGAHGDWVLGTAFSVDASHLVSVSRDRTMKLIKVDTQQFIDNITSITPGALKGGLMAIDCHPKKDELLVGGADGVPKIYRMHREKARKIGDDYNLIRAFDQLPGRIFSLEFDRTGDRFVVGSSFNGQGEVRVFQTADGKAVWKLDPGTAVYTVAFSPDGATIAIGGFDGKVRLIDATSGTVGTTFVPVPLETITRIF